VEFYAYSVIPYGAFVQSQEGIEELYKWPPSLYLYAKAFAQLFFWMPAVRRRKLQALSSQPIFFLGPCVPDAFEHIH
jgi:hypothetical protein